MKTVIESNGRIRTWKSIAAACRPPVCEKTAENYANLPRDPLRVRYLAGEPYVERVVLEAWCRRRAGDTTLEKIHTGSAIRAKLRKDLGTCSWSRYSAIVNRERDPLPVENLTGQRQRGVPVPDTWIYADAYRDWLQANDLPYLARLAVRSVRRAGNAGPVRARLRAG